MRKYYYLLAVILFVSVYFIASHFEVTEEKRLAKHRVGIEKLSPLEQELVGRWWSSVSGFGSSTKEKNYMLFSADKKYWRRRADYNKSNHGSWQINAEDSVLSIKQKGRNYQDRKFKIHAIDSNFLKVEEIKQSKYDQTARWIRVE